MENLKNLMQDIVDNGDTRMDRTNTGTKAVFGRTMRFDLKETFPVPTTKKLAFKAMASELIWFMKGCSNENHLKELLHGDDIDGKNTIWTGNRTADYWKHKEKFDGDLGRIYGQQWRYLKKHLPEPNAELLYNDDGKQLDVINYYIGYYREDTYLGEKCYNDEDSLLLKEWKSIIMDVITGKYKIENRWLDFDSFKEDVKKLDNYSFKKLEPDNYHLSADYHQIKYYSRYSTTWLDTKNHDMLKNGEQCVAVNKGKIAVGMSSEDLTVTLSHLTVAEIESAISTGLPTNDGWTIKKKKITSPYIRYDQLNEVIRTLKHDPTSRRMIISAWNPTEFDEMALPPCHIMMQFFVKEVDGVKLLSCIMYQRSVDTFLGLPFNISSYSLMTKLIAHHVGMVADEFIWFGGDVHIYSNHADAVDEQLQRELFDLPTIEINYKDKFEDYQVSDFVLVDYKYGNPIKAPMAV